MRVGKTVTVTTSPERKVKKANERPSPWRTEEPIPVEIPKKEKVKKEEPVPV